MPGNEWKSQSYIENLTADKEQALGNTKRGMDFRLPGI